MPSSPPPPPVASTAPQQQQQSTTKPKYTSISVSVESENRLRAWLHSVPNATPVRLDLPSLSNISSPSTKLPPPPPPLPRTPEACSTTTTTAPNFPTSLALPPPLALKFTDISSFDDEPQPETTTVTATTATANTPHASTIIDYIPTNRVRERVAKLEALADEHPQPHSLAFPFSHTRYDGERDREADLYKDRDRIRDRDRERDREKYTDEHDGTDFDGTSLTLSPPVHHPTSSVGSRASRPHHRQQHHVPKRTRRHASHDTLHYPTIPPDLIPPDSARQLARQLAQQQQPHSSNTTPRPPPVPPIALTPLQLQEPPPAADYLEPYSKNTLTTGSVQVFSSPPLRPYSPAAVPPLSLSLSAGRRGRDNDFPSTPPLPPSPLPYLSHLPSNSPHSTRYRQVRTPTTAPVSVSVSDTGSVSASGPFSSSSQIPTSRPYTLPDTPPPPVSPLPQEPNATSKTNATPSVTPIIKDDEQPVPVRIPSIVPLQQSRQHSKITPMVNPPLPNIPPPPLRRKSVPRSTSKPPWTGTTLPEPPKIMKHASVQGNGPSGLNPLPPPRPPNYAPPRDSRIPSSPSKGTKPLKLPLPLPLPPPLDDSRRPPRPQYGFDRNDSVTMADRIPSATGFNRNISELRRSDNVPSRNRSDLGIRRSSQTGVAFSNRRASTNAAVDTAEGVHIGRTESGTHGVARVPSLRISTSNSKKGSERLLGTASELGLGIEHVTSEHFGRTGSTNGPNGMPGSFLRTDSAASGMGSNNPMAALRVTFMSVKSYGNTEKSSSSLGEDVNGFVGGVYRSQLGSGDMRNGDGSLRNVWKSQWSSTAIGLPSKVAEAAGMLYRSGSIDDHWIIGQIIGEGACSAVRFAERRNGRDQVAVKIVSKGAPDLFCSSTGDCREVMAFKAVGRHPNVVQCHEIFEDDRFIYIVMELLAGGAMLPRVADSTHYYPQYCENDVITLVRGITRGLACLHQLGIAHRDLKPENILFSSENLDPTVKVMDFGIAYTNCKRDEARDMVGTPLYVAPEVLNRKPYGTAADMWSLGVIAHILLTGYPPFDDDDLVQLVNMVKSKPLRHLGEEWVVISENGRDFVDSLLTRDVSARLTAEKALAHPWLSKQRQAPLPSSPSRLTKVAIPPTKESRQDGNIPLIVAQTNLQSFVVRKEWKRMIESEVSDRNMKLGMLVALSEKDLNLPESLNNLEKTNNESNNSAIHESRMKESRSRHRSNMDAPGNTSSSKPPKGGKHGRANQANNKRIDEKLVHEEEQERLRQRRLAVQAELSKKQRMKANKHDGRVEKSSSSDSISVRNRVKLEISSDIFEPDSKLIDETLDESFQTRRDADADTDSSVVQRHRTEGETSQWRGGFMGLRSRHSGTPKHTDKTDQSKNTKVKGVRKLRRQRNTTTVPGTEAT